MAILDDIFRYRGLSSQGGNPHRFVELRGGREVCMLTAEPDPETYREKYYYNSRLNRLFMKITSSNPITGRISSYWKKVSEY